jgi:predicted DNA-binding mobile mystery protein A
MSAAALASRLGTTAGAVIRLEQSEAADRARLETLRRAADALGCDLVYLFVPRRPLTSVVRDRARELAHSQVVAVEQTMRLEDQATGQTSELEDQLTEQLLQRGRLWGSPVADRRGMAEAPAQEDVRPGMGLGRPVPDC